MGWNLMVQYLILSIFFCVIIIFVLCLFLIKFMERRGHRKLQKQVQKEKEHILAQAHLEAKAIIDHAKKAASQTKGVDAKQP